MRILVISAHPDDEILGVGGTICKHVENKDEVYICIVTKAYEPEWSKEYMETKIIEQKEVDKLLKIKKRFNLDLPTVKLNTVPSGELNKKIENVIEDVKPDIVYTHYQHDLNHDHTLIFKACLVATRPPKNIKLMCYETLSSTEWSYSSFQPNIWVNIKEYINLKIKAFETYKSEIKSYPHPRSSEGIKILAQKRGSEICREYAEAFILIRDFF